MKAGDPRKACAAARKANLTGISPPAGTTQAATASALGTGRATSSHSA